MTFYNGWLISEEDRQQLMTVIPTEYPDVYAHHVTLAYDIPEDTPLPEAKKGVVMGIADDHEGIQALIVMIDGSLWRPDGKIYHITWSLNKEMGYSPKDSNDLIKLYGYDHIDPVEIDLEPFMGE